MTWYHPALAQRALDEDGREIRQLRAEIERLRAAQSTILHRLARLIDNAGPVSHGCDAQSWGAGFQTAHQMALNIVNAALEQNEDIK